MSWVQTYTGLKFDLISPDPSQICLEDIAHSLSMQCRFSGHVSKFYSVAEHSLLAAEIAMRITGNLHEIRYAFMHDAAECYTGDLSSPLKEQLHMAPIEDAIQMSIMRHFELPWPVLYRITVAVRQIDLLLLRHEAESLLPGGPICDWAVDFPRFDRFYGDPVELKCFSPTEAKSEFLQLAADLGISD